MSNGINTNRLFLDSVSNKYFYISPDGISKRLELFDTTLNIHITTQSKNATTGALIIDGGISINATEDAINSSNGGALTVSGGVAVGGNTFLSKKLTVGELYTNKHGILVRYTGNSQVALQNSTGTSTTTFNMEGDNLVIATQNDLLFKTTTGNFVFSNASTGNSLLTMTGKYSTFDKFVNITDTVESKNLTTASLIVKGGISIQCTTDAISMTSGGAISINGGLGVAKKTYIGDSLGLELWNTTKANKFLLFQQQQTVTEANIFTGLGVTSGSLRLQVYDTSKDFTFFSSFMTSTMLAGLVYVGQQYAQAVGKTGEERDDFLERRLSPEAIGGATFQIPTPVRDSRKRSLAIKWLIGFSLKRNEKTMSEKLAGEILAASKEEGAAFKKKEDVHRMAEANKAFSHFRF